MCPPNWLISLVINLFLSAQASWATTTCPTPPYSTPSCPCTGSPLTDGTIASSGIWCFNGGDDTLTNVIIQGTAIVYICSNVTLYNWGFTSSATLIIAPNAAVTISTSYNAVYINTGVTIVNYGSISFEGFTSFSSGAALYNEGTIQATNQFIINAGATYVGGIASTLNTDTLVLNGTCAACLNGANVSTNYLETGSGANNFCGDSLFSCVQVNTAANVTADLTGDATIGFCGNGVADIDSAFYGSAGSVSLTCPCIDPFSLIRLLLRAAPDKDQRQCLLTWSWMDNRLPPAPVQYYRVYRMSPSPGTNPDDAPTWDILATTTDQTYRDETFYQCANACIYRVGAIIYGNQEILSEAVIVWRDPHQMFVMIGGDSRIRLWCQTQRCQLAVFNLEGQHLQTTTLHKDEQIVLGTALPAGAYILKVLEGHLVSKLR